MKKKHTYHFVVSSAPTFVSYRLGNKTSFLEHIGNEVGRFIDFRNSIFHKRKIYFDKKKSDYDCLLEDWQKIGNDIYISMETFENENPNKKVNAKS